MRKILSIVGLASLALVGCGESAKDPSLVRSLTGDDYTGRKYYFGWGAAANGDPSMMHNEVKYDVLHTHDTSPTRSAATTSAPSRRTTSEILAWVLRSKKP